MSAALRRIPWAGILAALIACGRREVATDHFLVLPDTPSVQEKGVSWNGVTTKLTVLDGKPVLGQPIRLRLDLVNAGSSTVTFDGQGTGANHSIDVVGPDGRRGPFIDISRQTGRFGKPPTLGPGQTAPLCKDLDLASQYLVDTAGKYHVRFSGRGFTIVGTDHEPALRSDWIEIDVADGKGPAHMQIARRLLPIAPKGWHVAALPGPEGTVEVTLSGFERLKSQVRIISLRFGEGRIPPGDERLGRSPWGTVTMTTVNNALNAWSDFRTQVRAALQVSPP